MVSMTNRLTARAYKISLDGYFRSQKCMDVRRNHEEPARSIKEMDSGQMNQVVFCIV